MPLHRGPLVPICIKIGSFVFQNIVFTNTWTNERTDGQPDNIIMPSPLSPACSVARRRRKKQLKSIKKFEKNRSLSDVLTRIAFTDGYSNLLFICCAHQS